jgi:glycine oxidase
MTHFSIIGAGAIGLLTAKELLDAGHAVTLFDRCLAGQESSWAGGGILLPIYPWRQSDAISQLVKISHQQYPDLCQTLYQNSGIDPEWYDSGLLISQNPDIDVALDWCERYGIHYETHCNTQLTQVNTTPLHPLWLPNIAQARNPRLVKALKQYVLNQGGRILERQELLNWKLEQGRITQIQTQAGSHRIEELILCSGAWSRRLLEKLLPKSDVHVPIEPVKGQMLLFDAPPGTLDFMVLDQDHYLIPRRDGKILAGSSVEYDGFNKDTSDTMRDQLWTFATRLLPVLETIPVTQHWAGLRPGSPKGVPFIGRHPEIQNLAINAGHFRNGLVMGPASACLLTDLVLQRSPCVAPEPYQLIRSF